jgi:hypothetical protein
MTKKFFEIDSNKFINSNCKPYIVRNKQNQILGKSSFIVYIVFLKGGGGLVVLIMPYDHFIFKITIKS